MKVKLKRFSKPKERIYGAPVWDGSIRINDKIFVPSKEYEVDETFYDEFKTLFTPIKEDKDE